jgi:hypothetical protein
MILRSFNRRRNQLPIRGIKVSRLRAGDLIEFWRPLMDFVGRWVTIFELGIPTSRKPPRKTDVGQQSSCIRICSRSNG